MIAKHVPMRTISKSSYAGLANYITDAQSKDHRLGQVRVTNCEAGSLRDAITEVLATQRINTRAAGDKTYHLLVSFRAGEQPGDDIIRAIEERICEGLGYGEHQRITAVHTDTDNLHIHIAINKIHPARHTMREPYYPHRTLAEICTSLERDYNLERDNHDPRRRGAESRAADMERHAGVESLITFIKRECLDKIKGAQTWKELHQVLRDNGLKLRPQANGFVFQAGDGTTVKASTVERDLSKPKLEARLGLFEASPEQRQTEVKREYRKDPIRLRVNTVELYAKYKAEQQNLTAERSKGLENARYRKDQKIEAVKRANRLRRAAIKILGENRAIKKLLYAQASGALRGGIQAISKEYQQDRAKLYARYSRRTWADWLKKEAEHGNNDALAALRAREAVQGLKGNTIRGKGQTQSGSASPPVDNITKKGTIIYRAGKSAVRDDGNCLQVSNEITREGLQVALRLAVQRYGNRITVNGSTEFKAQIIRAAVDSKLSITFSDPALESRRQALLKKEESHERRTEKPEYRGRTGRGFSGPGQRAASDQHGAGIAVVARGADADSYAAAVRRKPDVGRIGRVPPPQSQNRLRELSELGVVRIKSGSEMLLPRDVPHHMEQRGTQSDNTLRRGTSRLRGVESGQSGQAAAHKYIEEREAKRKSGFDIPKHLSYTSGDGDLKFQGIRNVEGQALALLQRGDKDEIMVMPIDKATAQRLKHVALGKVVSITSKGSIKTSGRSR